MRYPESQGALLLFTILLKIMVSMAAGNVRVFSKGATEFTKSHSAHRCLSFSLMIGQTGERGELLWQCLSYNVQKDTRKDFTFFSTTAFFIRASAYRFVDIHMEEREQQFINSTK